MRVVFSWFAGCTDPGEVAVPEPEPTDPTTTRPPATCIADPAAGVVSVDVVPHYLENQREVTVVLGAASDAALLCVDRADPDERVLLESPSAVEHRFTVQGLRFDTVYDCVAGPIWPADGAVSGFALEIGEPPSWTPTVTVTDTPDHPVPDGYVLTALSVSGGCLNVGHLTVLDTSGRLRWHYPLLGAELGVEVLHVGDEVLVYGGSTGEPGPAAVDLWDGEVWAEDLPGEAYQHHDAKQLADGRILSLETRINTADGQSWAGFAVRTSDPATGLVDFEYDSQQGVDQGILTPGIGDAWHANWVDLVDHDTGPILYVSLCFTSEVLAIDPTTGDIRWVFGAGRDFALVDPAGSPLDDAEFPQCQHGLEVSADGSRLLLYDNGRIRGQSRVAEYALDPATGVATLLWTWYDDVWFERTLGDVDWLPNGNVLVTEGHAECWSNGDPSELVEFEPTTGEAWWRMSFEPATVAIYRAQRLDGCEVFANVGQCAGLEGRWAELAGPFGL